jgi:signal transduction histidine kinase
MEQDERDILLQKFAEANRKLMAANEELEAANRKLKEYEEKAAKAEKASQMKSLFLANMSHEIRTPLNAIEGFARIIAETDSQEERMNFLEIIESNNNRLMSLVNEILDLSRVESGAMVLKKNSVDLDKLFASIKQLFKFRCPDCIRLNYQTPAMHVTMTTDENRLTQVFSNLISNALKHTSRGSITYGYRLINDGTEVEFFVTDTGSGIAQKDLENIFDAYFSRDAEVQNGYGLGLSIAKWIADKHGGYFEVLSYEKLGTRISLVLPYERDDEVMKS